MWTMLRKEFQEIDTGRHALRSFGVLVGLVLVGIGLFAVWKHDWTVTPASSVLSAAGALLVGSALLAPTALRPVYRLWMGLAIVLGFGMTRVLLTIVFYSMITPTALLLRLFGKDPLRRTWEPDAASYWIDKSYDDDTPQRLERYY